MKISAVSSRSGVTSSTVKYYVREGLVPEGHRTGSNQTAYDEDHVQRIRLVRALIETGGLSITATRRVLAVLDDHQDNLAYAFEAAQHALGAVGGARARDASATARQRIAELAAFVGWRTTDDNPGLGLAARALDGLATIDFEPSADYLAAYAEAASAVARADLAALGTRSRPDAITELMVVGSVMGDALLAGLRRLAQQDETAATFLPADATTGSSA
ncbi:MAG: MerR family transcriptional regulator [Terrimesophilobacter sp.]